jgi:hypothetical protein
MRWFKWTYFHDRVLLLPQRCCLDHDAANAASHGHQRIPANDSGGFAPLCYVEIDDRGTGSSERHCDF